MTTRSVIIAHALDALPRLPAESVNLVVTSPPYWSLRDYTGLPPIVWGVYLWTDNLINAVAKLASLISKDGA